MRTPQGFAGAARDASVRPKTAGRLFTSPFLRASLAVGLVLLCDGCSIRRMAVNKVADALAGSGATFASDDDPDLIKAAAPFSLKLMESVLAENPSHTGLLSAACSGFTQYSYAFVQQDADEMEEKDLAAAEALRSRARRLYARARDYGLRGLDARHKDFEQRLRTAPTEAVQVAARADVPLLYWTAVSWAGQISLSKDRPDVIADIPFMQALIDRALVLDESFGEGAIHAFLITYEMSRQGGEGKPAERSRRHFERAMELSGHRSAGPLVALAEAVCIQEQNVTEFTQLLQRANAIDPDAAPNLRLANLVAQRRARWLLARTDDLFLRPTPDSSLK